MYPYHENVPWLSQNHWASENYKQVMDSKVWRRILLTGGNRYMVNGEMRTFKGKSLGFGVVEVYKEPLK